jgi:hypothetical protein
MLVRRVDDVIRPVWERRYFHDNHNPQDHMANGGLRVLAAIALAELAASHGVILARPNLLPHDLQLRLPSHAA